MNELDTTNLVALLALIVATAALYASVGQGGGSGYLVAMALFGLAPAFMKPAALAMNIAVSALGFLRLARAGHFEARLFLPFALGSVPAAYLGGAYTLSDAVYKYIVGAALLLAAGRLFREQPDTIEAAVRRLPFAAAVALGAGIGLLAGLTGVGGGIFLSPVLLFLRLTTMRQNAAIAAAFILVNSIAGLAGYAYSAPGSSFPEGLWLYVAAALAGGAVGSELAVRRLAPAALKKLLAVLLVIAAAKLILTA